MAYKRILTIQDISCVGQCSTTVALPILSACGHECCILPTAVLSTHTGGFGTPAVAGLDKRMRDMVRHWKENNILFDAILVGYLGSIAAVEMVKEILDTMLVPGGLAIVDPAMADNGKLYAGFDDAYARAIGNLCEKADIIIPNMTEAALLADFSYREYAQEEIGALLDKLPGGMTILTGVGFRPEMTGVMIGTAAERQHYTHPRLGKSYHGTGDMFAACFTGALLQGKDVYEAAKLAADFVCESIRATEDDPAHWYGVKFETALPWLIKKLNEE